MNTIQALSIIGSLIAIFVSITSGTWKLAQIKDDLENDYENKIDEIRKEYNAKFTAYRESFLQKIENNTNKIIQLQTAVQLMQSNIDNEFKSQHDRVTVLHSNSKRKYADLITVVNQHTVVLNKLQKDTHIYKVREKDTMGFNGDDDESSWTQL